MEASTLRHVIQSQEIVRVRIESIVRSLWWGDANADPTARVPVEALAWAVAADERVTELVQSALIKAQETGDAEGAVVARTLSFIPDEVMESILTAALDRLG